MSYTRCRNTIYGQKQNINYQKFFFTTSIVTGLNESGRKKIQLKFIQKKKTEAEVEIEAERVVFL